MNTTPSKDVEIKVDSNLNSHVSIVLNEFKMNNASLSLSTSFSIQEIAYENSPPTIYAQKEEELKDNNKENNNKSNQSPYSTAPTTLSQRSKSLLFDPAMNCIPPNIESYYYSDEDPMITDGIIADSIQHAHNSYNSADVYFSEIDIGNDAGNENTNESSIIYDNNSTTESKFDPCKHCRYCFSFMLETDNYSACKCTGLLCEQCLQKELKISFDRVMKQVSSPTTSQFFRVNNIQIRNQAINNQITNPVLKCTVCQYQYLVHRLNKLQIEKSSFYFLKYFCQKTFPNMKYQRDLSVFQEWTANEYSHRRNDVFPIKIGRTIIAVIAFWILFTIVGEMFGKYRISEARMCLLLVDIYSIYQISNVTAFFDFPERIWISILYVLRFVVFGIFAAFSFLCEKRIYFYNDNYLINKLRWHWLLLYLIVSATFLLVEISRFMKDLHGRATKDDEKEIRFMITSAKGVKFGPYMFPKPQQTNDLERQRWSANLDLLTEFEQHRFP